jgi:hypothetical protein
MNSDKETYKLVNKILQEKVYTYDGPLTSYSGIKLKFNYKFKIVGNISLKHMGEPMNHLAIELIVVDIEYKEFIDLFKSFDTDDLYKNRYNFEDRFYYLSGEVKNQIWDELKYFSITDTPEIVRVKIDIPELNNNEMKQITESKSEKRDVVRKLVRDIISVFKKEGEGEYDLPTDINGEDYYYFDNLNTEFNLELRIVKTDTVDGFELDGGYYEEDDVMEIEILFNPDFFPQQLYDLVGELNETVRHELQHLIQYEKGETHEPDESSSEVYYTQQHELDAQVAGLKRISKLRKQPFEKVTRDWFTKNINKHGMDEKTAERVIQRILQFHKNGK